MSPTPHATMQTRRPSLPGAVLAVILAGSASALAAAAAGPQEPPVHAAPESTRPEEASSDRGALRAEHAVARRLARLDEELGLGTFPDASPHWPSRLAASIESRGDDEPAQALLARLAVELRGLGVEWSLGGRPDERPDGRAAAASPVGRERAERIRRIRELVELVIRKLEIDGAGDAPPGSPREGRRSSQMATSAPGPSRIASRQGSDSCAAAISLSLGHTSGHTYGTTSDGEASCDGPGSSPDVWYVFTPPEDGSYTFETLDDYFMFDTVLSLHSGCPLPDDHRELACSDDVGTSLLSSISYPLTGGEPVWVRVSGYGGDYGDYRLRASLDRTIRGTVTRADTGDPLAGAAVEILDRRGYVFSEATTGADGTYAAGVSASTELYARARDDGYVTELYDDLECPFPSSCSRYGADPISTSSSDASGIDFALAPGGSISGAITAADTGEPPTRSQYVELYDDTGTYLGSRSFPAGSASFHIESLLPGSYYVRVSTYGYQEEVWDGVACTYPCDATSGTLIVVDGGSEVSGIDFVLDRLGKIRGTVSVQGEGAPVDSATVAVYDEAGDFSGSGYAQSDGSYEVSFLRKGDHFARSSTFAYRDELYDDVLCEPDCDPTSGTPIPVELNGPTSGIDFALVPKASIAGTVTDADSGEALNVRVFLYDAAGDQIGVEWTDGLGEYEFRGLEAGSYFLRAGYYSHQQGTHEEELYDDIPCEPGCDPTTGTPVLTSSISPISGIDFALRRRGWISGTVTDATGGEPLHDVPVRAFDLEGNPAAYDSTDSDGTYELRYLPAGSYRVGTDASRHQDEMYDGVVCGAPCDRTTGAPVGVQATVETPGIDFALTRLGSISGRVTAAATGAGVYADVYLLDLAGASQGRTSTASGFFELAGIPPGSYLLLARDDYFDPYYQDELYADVPCQPDCDLAEGTPIVVELESTLTGYDFALARCPYDSLHEVGPGTIDTYFKALACDRVTAGAVTLAPGADAVFRSGRSVVLGDGFKVEDGATLRIVIEPAWSDD